VFARDKQCSDTDKLEFGPQDIDFAAVSINYADAEVECLWDKAEFHVDFDEPINEDCPHPGIYVLLSKHVRFHFVACLVGNEGWGSNKLSKTNNYDIVFDNDDMSKQKLTSAL